MAASDGSDGCFRLLVHDFLLAPGRWPTRAVAGKKIRPERPGATVRTVRRQVSMTANTLPMSGLRADGWDTLNRPQPSADRPRRVPRPPRRPGAAGELAQSGPSKRRPMRGPGESRRRE